VHQGAAQLAPGDEVGVGNHHLLSGAANRLQVGFFDVVAVAHVVAQQQGGVGRGAGWPMRLVPRFQPRQGFAQGLPGGAEFALAGRAHRLQAPPQLLHRLQHVGHQRAAHLQREIQPRPLEPAQGITDCP